MIVLIMGASHTGKTLLAQRMMERYHYPYFSEDLLKMGLIRSGYTGLSPEDDAELTEYLWPVVREMIKTAVENRQNLIVEGCYIPFNWADDFEPAYLEDIRCRCLVMSKKYIRNHFDDIRKKACIIEQRKADSEYTVEEIIEDNEAVLSAVRKYGLPFTLIDDQYDVSTEL